jgi:hypothetical protein
MTCPKEKKITIDGVELTNAQAATLRVAVTSFHADRDGLAAMGETGDLYRARLDELLRLLM